MIRSARGKAAAMAVAAALVLAPGAAADEGGGGPGSFQWRLDSWHVSLGVRADFIPVPHLTTGLANSVAGGGGLPVFFTHRFGRVTVLGFAGEGGYALPAGTLPAWLGENTRILAFGHWGGAGSQGSYLARPWPDGWSVVSVNGLLLEQGFGDRFLRSRADVTEKRSAFGVLATTDYALAQDLWLSAELAARFGRARRAYAVVEDLDRAIPEEGPPDPATVRTVDARIHTQEFGGVFGGRLTWRPSETLALHVAGRVALLWRRVRLDVNDCLGDNLGSFEAPLCTGSRFVTATSQRQTGFVAVPGGEIGIAASLAPGIVFRVSGGVDYDPRSPGVRLPTATDRRPASLTFQGAVIYNVQAMLTVAIW
jgi:hypothetical protein